MRAEIATGRRERQFKTFPVSQQLCTDDQNVAFKNSAVLPTGDTRVFQFESVSQPHSAPQVPKFVQDHIPPVPPGSNLVLK